MNIIEALVQLRNDLKLWVTNNLRVKADKTYVEEMVAEVKADSSSKDAVVLLEVQNNIDSKVDKEDGKGLSSNDFTDEEKAKLAGLTGSAATVVNIPDNTLLLSGGQALLPRDGLYTSIIYANGEFVAASANAYGHTAVVVKSVNGINWAENALPENFVGVLVSIAYGNGVFVAFPYMTYQSGSLSANPHNKMAYSADGINWSLSTLPNNAWWRDVAYGSGKFVALGQNNQNGAFAVWSTDGINWNSSDIQTENKWKSITYGDGKFVAISIGNTAAYSTDGIAWATSTLPTEAEWSDIAYGNGKFVATSSVDNAAAAYSVDGITWTASTLPEAGYWNKIAYGDGNFVAMNSNNVAAVSPDGINWTPYNMPSFENFSWQSIAYGNGKFVAVGGCTKNDSVSNMVAYSTDGGITWQCSSNYYLSDANDVDVTRATLIAIGAAPVIQYGTTDVTNGSESPYPDGTLYVVIE